MVGILLAISARVWYKKPTPYDIYKLIVCADNINVGKIKGEKFVARKHIDNGTKLFPESFGYKLEEKDEGIVEFMPIEVIIKIDLEKPEGS